jgi:hypothetical protein
VSLDRNKPCHLRCNMKSFIPVLVLLLSGCQSMSSTAVGMNEKDWLRNTLIADLAYMDGSVKAYRSGGMYYYFVDGKLQRVDQGMLPAKTIRLELK